MQLFELHIEPIAGQSDEYTVRTGGATAQAHFGGDPAFDDFEAAVNRLYDRTPIARIKDRAAHAQLCTHIGETLFRSFVVGDVLDAYHQYDAQRGGRPRRVGLYLHRSLYRWPWELLRDPDDPLGLFLSMHGSLVRNDVQSSRKRKATYQPADKALTLVSVCPNPSDYEAVGAVKFRSTKTVKFDEVNPATYKGFDAAARKSNKPPRGFVFFGHGEINGDGRGVLLFVKQEGQSMFATRYVADRYTGQNLSTALGTMQDALVGCVLACESAWVRGDVPFEKTIAGELLEGSWLPFVLAAQMKIASTAALLFFTAMLEDLSGGAPLDLAIATGRRAVISSEQSSNLVLGPLDWWIPVLYARESNFTIMGRAAVQLPAIPARGV